MCILFVSVDPTSGDGRRVVVASNRDEFYARPAAPAEYDADRRIIAGKDMLEGHQGGMWLGVSTKRLGDCGFRFAALLNVSGEKRDGAKGRGFLVADYLDGDLLTPQYVEKLEGEETCYNSFNLVTVECSETEAIIYHYSNSPPHLYKYEGKQTLGFGNSNPEKPFRKVTEGTKIFQDLLGKSTDENQLIADLVTFLKCPNKHLPDDELQRRQPTAFEGLSSVFVRMEVAGYGTRTHSIILVDDSWNLTFTETTLADPIDPANPNWSTRSIKCRL